MKRKNMTRNALFTSIISLLLCVSMLVGTTFAWFTDEVNSGNNTIAAGNLDIELYHSNAKVSHDKVDAATDLFLDVNGNEILWEPGVVSYENIEIANVGSLALQYRLSLDIFDENNLNGHKLSEVLKVVLLDDAIPAGATRAEVMALATAALEDPAYTLDGKLTHLVEQGNLYPAGSAEGASSITGALVIFWAPNSNDVDNLYNANNGQETSDGQALRIDFGVHLEATQLMYEDDSFGNDYDKLTGFTPVPSVDGYGPEISYTEGIGGEVKTLKLDAAYQFRPTETYEEGQLSEYFNYIVDFEVSADRYVPADSILLAGYYKAWCGNPDDPNDPDSWNLNNGNWVGLIGGDVQAGEKIRLVNDGLGESYNIQYKHLLEYGNDGIGFLCGLKDLDTTGANAGTTITVKLNMYKAVLDADGHYRETGEVETRGVFTYTFPAVAVNNATELNGALTAGVGSVQLSAGEYEMPSNNTATDITITGTKDTVIDVTAGAYLANASIVFDGVTIKTGTGYANGNGSDYAALYSPNVIYKNCTFVGPMRVGRDGAQFINCTFTQLGNDYVWTYGNDVSFENCTFKTEGKAILIYSDGGNEVANVSVKGCVFESTQGAKAGAIANQNCAAIEIDNYGNGVNLIAEDNTYDSNFSGEWRIKTYKTGRPQIIVNGTEYTQIAIDGKLMTIDADRNVTVM